MSRQNNNNPRERKNDEPKRDAASNGGRFSRENKENRPDDSRRGSTRHIHHLDRYTLNDLYERSSI